VYSQCLWILYPGHILVRAVIFAYIVKLMKFLMGADYFMMTWKIMSRESLNKTNKQHQLISKVL